MRRNRMIVDLLLVTLAIGIVTLCLLIREANASSTLVSGRTATKYRYDSSVLITNNVNLPAIEHHKMKALPSRNRVYKSHPLSHIKHWRAGYVSSVAA